MVRRESAFESLLREHGTVQMAEYRLAQRGQRLGDVRQRHEAIISAAQVALGRVPTVWRKTWVLRRDLDRFRFAPEDLVVAVGLDGLVPNVAKYLTGQPVVGVNPTEWPQRMMHFKAGDLAHLYASGTPKTEPRTMVRVAMDDGRELLALNEVFCGHTSHQSAKYDIAYAGQTEYQSSSGLIVTTGTGATGWASSIAAASGLDVAELPAPTDPLIYFLVREAWASSFTGTALGRGAVAHRSNLHLVSKMQEGGVLFGDGIESDALAFSWGQSADFSVADRVLNLAIP
ncbi:MAG: hypothetical protein ACI9WU_001623 [Myxococcota bacterium]|jgi:hypothetical protein